MTLLPDTDPILRQKSQPVLEITDEVRVLGYDLKRLCEEHAGVAIAAPQVGKLVRVIYVQGIGVMVNPVVMQKQSSDIDTEGCLTFPGMYRNIKRAGRVKVKWRDLNYKMQYGEFAGLLSRAIQHETDHLDGKLFTDYENCSDL